MAHYNDPPVKNFTFDGKYHFSGELLVLQKKKRTKSIFINLFPSKSVPEAIKSIIY